MFDHFGWKLPIWGQIVSVLGINRGQISIFLFYNPQKAHSCVILRLLSHYVSKSLQGSAVYGVPRKSHKKVIFHPCAQKAPGRIFSHQIWNKRFSCQRNQSLTNYISICSRVSILQGVKFSVFPIGN